MPPLSYSIATTPRCRYVQRVVSRLGPSACATNVVTPLPLATRALQMPSTPRWRYVQRVVSRSGPSACATTSSRRCPYSHHSYAISALVTAAAAVAPTMRNSNSSPTSSPTTPHHHLLFYHLFTTAALLRTVFLRMSCRQAGPAVPGLMRSNLSPFTPAHHHPHSAPGSKS